MVKEEINLLPPAVLKARVQAVYGRHVSGLLGSIVISLLVVGLALGAAVVAQRQITGNTILPVADNPSVTHDNQQQMQRVNDMIALAQHSYQDRVAWMPLVGQAVRQIPEGISMAVITINAGQHILRLQGTSQVRSNVVVLENTLRALPWVQSLDAPLQNFAASPSTSFSFTLHYKPVTQ